MSQITSSLSKAVLAVSLLAGCSNLFQSDEESKLRAMIAANMANPETIQFSDFTEMNVSEYLKVYEEIVVADQYELMQQVFIELPAGARPYADLGGQLKKNVAAKLSDEAKRLRSAKLRLFKIRYKFDNREGSQTTMISACTLSLQKFECLSSNLPQKL